MNDCYDARWFVSGHHHLSGRPSMENLLVREAISNLEHCIVYEKDFRNIVADLGFTQKKIRLEKPNLKKVDNLTILRHGPDDDIAWLTIGESHLTLQKIKAEIKY